MERLYSLLSQMITKIKEKLPVAGGTMTGTLEIQSPHITLGSPPSASQTGRYIRYKDSADTTIASIYPVYNTAGRVSFIISSRLASGGDPVRNDLQLSVNADGSLFVYLSAPAAWRTALGLDDEPTIDSSQLVSSGGVASAIEAESSARQEADRQLQAAVDDKQNSLTAGDYIDITGDTISASGLLPLTGGEITGSLVALDGRGIASQRTDDGVTKKLYMQAAEMADGSYAGQINYSVDESDVGYLRFIESGNVEFGRNIRLQHGCGVAAYTYDGSQSLFLIRRVGDNDATVVGVDSLPTRIYGSPVYLGSDTTPVVTADGVRNWVTKDEIEPTLVSTTQLTVTGVAMEGLYVYTIGKMAYVRAQITLSEGGVYTSWTNVASGLPTPLRAVYNQCAGRATTYSRPLDIVVTTDGYLQIRNGANNGGYMYFISECYPIA